MSHVVDRDGANVAQLAHHADENIDANSRLIVTAVNAHAELLAAAKEMLSVVATRDIGSFTWESRAANSLKAAIAKAEELAP